MPDWNNCFGKGHVPYWLYGIFFLWMASTAGCSADQNTAPRKKTTSAKRLKHYNAVVYPAISTRAIHGALVFRMGTDFTSIVLSRFGGKDTLFSHCGIISIEADSVLVYHSIGGADNPEAKMKREPLHTFCHPSVSRRIGFFLPKLTAGEITALVLRAKEYYRIPISFDMAFDLSSDSLQYCSELVYKCWKYACPTLNLALPVTSTGKTFVPISSLYLSPWSFKNFVITY